MQHDTLTLNKEDQITLNFRPYKHQKDVALSNFYLFNAHHRPIHAYKLTTTPSMPSKSDFYALVSHLHPNLKEVFDFYVFIADPLYLKNVKLADMVLYSFNDIIEKQEYEVTVKDSKIKVSISKVRKGFILTYSKQKQHYLSVYNTLFCTLVSHSDHQFLLTPFTYSNQGLFYLNKETITHPDEIWQILKDTVKQVKRLQGDEEKINKEREYRRVSSEVRRERDWDSEEDEEEEIEETVEDEKEETDFMENNQILQGTLNMSVRRKHTYLKRIRDSEEVYKGWEYQLKFLEKGLGIFLRPIVVRKNKDTVHEYCTELADILLYQSGKQQKIKKLEKMLIGKVVIKAGDKSKVYQIINVNRSKCPKLHQNSTLFDEYDESYLDCIRVDLKEWLGRPVTLTDFEARLIVKNVSLKEISELYHKVFCRETNIEKLFLTNFKLLKMLNFLALKKLNIFDCYEVFSTKPWKCIGKFIENPLIDISKIGLTKRRDTKYLEFDRNIDTEILDYEINFPPPLNRWDLFCCDKETTNFFLTMLDNVCHKKEIRSVEIPNVYTVGQIKEFDDDKWGKFFESGDDKKSHFSDVCELINRQRYEWERKFLELEKAIKTDDTYVRPAVVVAILSSKEEELDKMYMQLVNDGKTLERTIRDFFFYRFGAPVVIVKINSDI
jgi:hypothetical protein